MEKVLAQLQHAREDDSRPTVTNSAPRPARPRPAHYLSLSSVLPECAGRSPVPPLLRESWFPSAPDGHLVTLRRIIQGLREMVTLPPKTGWVLVEFSELFQVRLTRVFCLRKQLVPASWLRPLG